MKKESNELEILKARIKILELEIEKLKLEGKTIPAPYPYPIYPPQPERPFWKSPVTYYGTTC